MPTKFQLITELYDQTVQNVTRSYESWTGFLRAACYNYKCPFDGQILIYAQRPDATAVLEMERWNRRFGRWVNRGAKSIAVFSDDGQNCLKLYQVPNLLMPQTPEVHLGKYAELRRQYLMKRRRVLYTNLKTSGKLTEHLAEIEQSAQKMVEQTVMQMAKTEGVTEELKATDPLRWTGLMNNLRHSAEELVLSDLIYC